MDRLISETGLATSRSYEYDHDGNRTKRVDGAVTTTFAYDRTDQLISLTSGSTRSFAYDRFGNQTTEALTGADQRTMAYDTGLRLISLVTAGAVTATFTPDALGRQLKRTASGVTEWYGYLGTSETVWAVHDQGAGGWRSGFDLGGATRIATTVGAATDPTYLVPDLLGSLVATETLASTAIAHAWRYDGYGQLLAKTATAPDLDIGFFGALDRSPDGTPLYDIGARYYSPASGAWSQLDTVMGNAQDPRTMNRFLYAHGNPATLIDPSGHAARSMTDGGSSGTTVAEKEADPKKYTSKYVAPKDYISARSGAGATKPAKPEPPAPTVSMAKADKHWEDPPLPEGYIDALLEQYKDEGFTVDLHGVLDVMGFLPGIGTVADLGNGLLYLFEGDVTMAALSAASAVPIAGDILAGGRMAVRYGDDVLGVIASRGDDVASMAARDADEVATIAGKSGDDILPTACARHSFAGDTPVSMADGSTEPIAEVQVGDAVSAYDPATGRTGAYAVSATFIHADPVTGTVEIDGELIEVTPAHPFMTAERGWVEAEDLRSGEHVPSLTNAAGLVGEIHWDRGPDTMYDLTVERVHTYAVGVGKWVVHNCHGNSLTSAKPQHLYEISATGPTGLTSTYKYGVSGGPVSAAGDSYRATSQVNALNKQAAAAGTGTTFSAQIVADAATRRDVLDLEASAVYGHIDTFGGRPPGNLKP